MNNTSKNHLYRFFALVFLYAYACIGYLSTNSINANRSWYLNVGFSFEESIPFHPEFMFMYVLMFLAMLMLYFIVTKKEEWVPLAKAIFLLTTIHFIFFLILPVKIHIRPEIIGTGLGYRLTKYIYEIDVPTNCFPSLHVAYPLIVAFMIKRLRIIYGLIAFGLALSVVLVKQHYIADIFGAIASSAIVAYVVRKWWNK